MRITVHPLFLVVLMTVALSGHIAMYSCMMLSLFVHELGHLVAATYVGARVRRCELMPYGGEITFENEYRLTSKQRLIVALGGPIATVLGMLITFALPDVIAKPLLFYQSILLIVNCLPFWPLDGGRIVYYSLLGVKHGFNAYVQLLWLSYCFFTIMLLLALLLFEQYVVALFSLFLLLQVAKEWRFRKYRAAFEKNVLKRLT